ncbi:MAG: hypothetical protein KIS94_14280 [Chitinophagales bacterium]|nr:hypothetical protein [Chitinophagales bacterium]
MKKRVVVFIGLLLSLTLHAQKEFEGKIVYDVKMEMPFLEQMMLMFMDTLTQAEKEKALADFRHTMDSMLVIKQEYFYKNGSYKSLMKFPVLGVEVLQYFDKKKGLLYNYDPVKEEATYFSVKQKEEGCPEKYEVSNKKATILGKSCTSLLATDAGYTTTTWYNSATGVINPEHFKSHKYQAFDVYTAKAKALPLKYSLETGFVNITATAIEIQSMSLKDEEFAIPKFKELTEVTPGNPLLNLGSQLGGMK